MGTTEELWVPGCSTLHRYSPSGSACGPTNAAPGFMFRPLEFGCPLPSHYCSELYGRTRGGSVTLVLRVGLRNATPRRRDTCRFGGSRRRRAAKIAFLRGRPRCLTVTGAKIRNTGGGCDSVTFLPYSSLQYFLPSHATQSHRDTQCPAHRSIGS